VCTSCYIESVLEERIEQGLITVFHVPDHVSNDEVPYHPELWTNYPKPAASAA
jgi:hypothetical protein